MHYECGACATVFGLIRGRVLILLGPPPLALCMRRVFNRLRAELRLGFDCVAAAIACTVNAARCDRRRSELRVGFNFLGAATACLVNAARVQSSPC